MALIKIDVPTETLDTGDFGLPFLGKINALFTAVKNAITAFNNQIDAGLAAEQSAAIAKSEADRASTIVLTPMLQIRKTKLDNPLCHLFSKNKLVTTLAGELLWTRATSATFVDRYGVVNTAAIDSSREEALGWLSEGTATNVALHNRDLTNSVWLKSDCAVLKNATGADGVANSASTITANGAVLGEGATVKQVFSLSAADRTFSVDIKRKIGTGRIFISENGNDGVDIEHLEITDLINTDTYTRVNITHNRANPVLSFIIENANDAIEVDYVQFESGLKPTSRIETTTAPATRAADKISIDYLNNFISAKPHTVFVNLKMTSGASGGRLFETTGTGQATLCTLISNSSRAQYNNATAPSDHNESICLVWDGTHTIIYNDGVEVAKEVSTPIVNERDTISLFNNSALIRSVDGHCSGLRIYDFGLNADEVMFLAGE